MHCLGERPQGDCNLWLIVNRSLRSNFQVRHDIAIGGTVAATKSVVPGARGDPGAVGVPALSLCSHLSSHRNKPHGQYGVLLDDVPMLMQKMKRLITGFANRNDHASTIAQLFD
jgi:hypothetical protein